MTRTDLPQVRKEIVDNLSTLIVFHLVSAARQQYCPDSDPDRMDAEIADGKEKAAELRRIREEFENLITGIIL